MKDAGGMNQENQTTNRGLPPASALQLLTENRDRFLGFLERRIGSREMAEEILQDAYVRGIAHAETLHDEESTVAWFYRLLRNTLTDHFRRTASAQRTRDAAAAEPAPPVPAPDDDELHRAICACLGETLPTLKPEYAQALRVVDLGGGDLAALGAAAGISPGNSAVRLHRARQALRKRLDQICGACSVHGCLDCTCAHPPRPPAR